MSILSIPSFSLNNIKVIPYVNFPPKTLFLLRQGTDKDSQSMMSPGQKVKRGQMIARANSPHTQAIHASIGGVVKGNKYFGFPGVTADIRTIEIHSGGEFSSLNKKKGADTDDGSIPMLSREELLNKLRNSGIYSIDTGVVFDYLSHKFANSSVTNIIVNAIEFSPYHKLEEKILQLHMKEITAVVSLLMNMYNQDQDNIKCIINSNSIMNKVKFSWILRNSTGEFPANYNMWNINLSNDYTTADLYENYTLIAKKLARKKAIKQLRETQEYALSAITVQDRSIIMRPSVLLAIYELLMFDKPYIDIYIQMIVGLDNVVVQRVPLGTPLIYLLAPYNKHWNEFPNHCFMGDFFHRKMLVNMVTPITKNNLHYWLLQDSDFTKLYKKLKKWLELSNSNLH